MTTHIRSVTIVDRALSPFEADVLIEVTVKSEALDGELRGRLVGPTCPYSTTIEVDYPLRPTMPLISPLVRRVVIPEPSLWSPATPFLYRGWLEIWEQGRLYERRTVRHGLRSMRVTRAGLIWNGKKLDVRAVDRPGVEASDLPKLRTEGINAVILDQPQLTLLPHLERLGFLTAFRPGGDPFTPPESPALFAVLLGPGQESRLAEMPPKTDRQCFVGWAGGDPPPGVDFVLGDAENSPLPCLADGRDGALGRIVR